MASDRVNEPGGYDMKKAATKKSKKRPIRQQQIIVFRDGAGNYYEVPRARLEASRVSDARKKKVAAALEDAPIIYRYIPGTAIPGSIAAHKFVGSRQLQYVGFYLSPTK